MGASRDVHRGVAQVAWATAHMPSSTHVALPRKKKNIYIYLFFNHLMDAEFHVGLDNKNRHSKHFIK